MWRFRRYYEDVIDGERKRVLFCSVEDVGEIYCCYGVRVGEGEMRGEGEYCLGFRMCLGRMGKWRG